MIQCVSVLCVLGVVMLGLLVMTRAVNGEQVGAVVGRAVTLLILGGFAYCVAGVAFGALLALLKRFIVWIGMAALAIGLLLLERVLSVVKKSLGFKKEGGEYE